MDPETPETEEISDDVLDEVAGGMTVAKKPTEQSL